MHNDTVDTAYGTVNRQALDELQNSFDTTKLEDVVNTIDRLRGQMHDLDELREKALLLWTMAAVVINDGPSSISGDGNISDLAIEVEDKLSDVSMLMKDFSKAASIRDRYFQA